MKSIFNKLFLIGAISCASMSLFFHQLEARALDRDPYITVVTSGVTASDTDFSDGEISITSPATLPGGSSGTIKVFMNSTGLHMDIRIGISTLKANLDVNWDTYMAAPVGTTDAWFDAGQAELYVTEAKGLFRGVDRVISTCLFHAVVLDEIGPFPVDEIQSQYTFYYR